MKLTAKYEFDVSSEEIEKSIEKSIDKWLKENPDYVLVVRCKDCKCFNYAGCAIEINVESDRPNEDDYCSFAERKDEK